MSDQHSNQEGQAGQNRQVGPRGTNGRPQAAGSKHPPSSQRTNQGQPVRRSRPIEPRDSHDRQGSRPTDDRYQQDGSSKKRRYPNQRFSRRPNRGPRDFNQIRPEETADDIRRENERIEKEIWLEIAGIHTYKLD